MRDRALIFSGLCLFVVLATFPVWYDLAARRGSAPQPRKGAGTFCVAPLPYMRASHMELLREWRDGKVRGNRRVFGAADGSAYPVSLTGTCLNRCHGSAEEFCNRCHSYAGVPVPNCWRCHSSPPAEARRTAPVVGRIAQ